MEVIHSVLAVKPSIEEINRDFVTMIDWIDALNVAIEELERGFVRTNPSFVLASAGFEEVEPKIERLVLALDTTFARLGALLPSFYASCRGFRTAGLRAFQTHPS